MISFKFLLNNILIPLVLVHAVHGQDWSLTFTGDVEVDFPESQDFNNQNFALGKYEIQVRSYYIRIH